MDEDRTEPIPAPLGPHDGPEWLTPNAPASTPIQPLRPARRSPALVIGIVGLVLLLAGGAAVFLLRSGGGEAVALAYSMEEGSTTRYRMTMTMDGTVGIALQDVPLETTVTATVTQEVLSVDEQGVATIEVRMEDVKVDSPFGVAPPTTDPEPVRMRVFPDGRIETVDGTLLGGTAGGLAPGGSQLSAILPDEPVEPGDTWTEEIEVPVPFGDGQTVRYETRSEFLRYEDVDGVEAAVIRTSSDIPIDAEVSFGDLGGLLGGVSLPPQMGDLSMGMSGTGSSDVTTWFDAEAGEQLRLEMENDLKVDISFEGAPLELGAIFGEGMSMDADITLELEPLP